jgi:hypothetical protein
VVYAGSVERTSFAEASETKGYVVVELSRRGLEQIEFRPLPARPMVTIAVSVEGAGDADVHARVAAAIAESPVDAVVRLRIEPAIPAGLTAGALRRMGGTRHVTLAAPAGERSPRTWQAGARRDDDVSRPRLRGPGEDPRP